MTNTTRITLHYSLAALKAERERLARLNWKEYTTRGNTPRCQELFAKVTKIDEQIKARESGGKMEIYYNNDTPFEIIRVKGGYEIRNSNGEFLRKCRTKKECKERIDTQTV